MRAQPDRIRLGPPFVLDERLKEFLGKNIAFQQKLVIFFEAAERTLPSDPGMDGTDFISSGERS